MDFGNFYHGIDMGAGFHPRPRAVVRGHQGEPEPTLAPSPGIGSEQ
jgi:hypothetical protein